ncbi:MAG: phosphoribosylamine--glycine ligase [Alkalispirochaeta sp.]
MKILVIGSGGREHALAWRLGTSRSVESVTVAPGNPGMTREGTISVVPQVPSPEQIRRDAYDLVIIGPEEPLVRGLADDLRRTGVSVVGPSREAAQLEGSKAFAKRFMTDHGIPTAEFRVCATIEDARRAVNELGAPVVVKADGLAAGKGVTVCRSLREAEAAIESIMRDRLFGEAGDVVVVERMLSGFEASILVLIDESGHVVLPTSQDHKPIGEGNTGPNTGGMGVIAPNPAISPELRRQIEAEIVVPSVEAIRSRGWLFRGVLFIGLMIDEAGPQTLEYNVRFGDPETQAVLPLIDGDFGTVMAGLAAGKLSDAIREAHFDVRDGAACAVIAASEGYPGPYTKGVPVTIDALPPGAFPDGGSQIFSAGIDATREIPDGPDRFITAGGRVLAATAWGPDLDAARRSAYTTMQTVHFDGMQYRRDIGGVPIVTGILEEGRVLLPRFEKRGGLLPVVVQDAGSKAVLMVGYSNRTAYEETRRTGYATFWSTSRNTLWTKGESSGDYLAIEEIRVDCDQDALLYLVRPVGGGVCHTVNAAGRHRRRCFYRRLGPSGLLELDE